MPSGQSALEKQTHNPHPQLSESVIASLHPARKNRNNVPMYLHGYACVLCPQRERGRTPVSQLALPIFEI